MIYRQIYKDQSTDITSTSIQRELLSSSSRLPQTCRLPNESPEVFVSSGSLTQIQEMTIINIIINHHVRQPEALDLFDLIPKVVPHHGVNPRLFGLVSGGDRLIQPTYASYVGPSQNGMVKTENLPSGKQTQLQKSLFSMGKSTITWLFSIAMLVYQRV